jgi:2-polyprenyl-6-methoxyphenol hydroxylase-like FAD-dependent oxidoreductase
MKLLFTVACLAMVVARAAHAGSDIVVIGGTPGGIATAVTAARLGRNVVLTEYHAAHPRFFAPSALVALTTR